MGNNAAFSSFEQTVVAVYNSGCLDKKLLSHLMEPYRDMDIDSGGMEDLLSKKDNLDVVDIVLKTFGKVPPKKPNLPKDFTKWTEDHIRKNDNYHDKRWEMFHKITSRFGWC
jgi:hypothetical protein